MTQSINEIRDLLNQLEEADKNNDDKLYKDTLNKISNSTKSLEKRKKSSKKVIFYKKKHLKKTKIRVRVIEKINKIAKVPLEALKTLKGNISKKVSSFFEGIGKKVTAAKEFVDKKVKNVKLKLESAKHLLKRKKRRLKARARIIKRVSKTRLKLLRSQIATKSNSLGFTNLRQKATIVGLTAENLLLKGAVNVKDKIDATKIIIVDKKRIAKRKIKRVVKGARKTIKHVTVDQVVELKRKIVAFKNKFMKKIKFELKDKDGLVGRIKLKLTGKFNKIKSVPANFIEGLKAKFGKPKGKHFADPSEARRKAMREFFRKYLSTSDEKISQNQEEINRLIEQREELRSQLTGQELEEVRARTM